MRTRRLSRGAELAMLLAIVLLAMTRGVWALGDKSLWWDESLSLHRAQLQAGQILAATITLTDNTTLLATTDDHPPLYFALLAAATKLLGKSEFALRFPSLASLVLAVPLLYLLGRRLADRWAGLAAAFLGAVSPMWLWYGQEARPYALVTLLSLISLTCFVRAFLGPEPGHEPTPNPRDGRWQGVWAACFFLTSLGMVLTHYLSVLLILFETAVLGLLVLRRHPPRRIISGTFLSMLGLLLLLAGYAAYQVLNGLDLTAGRPGVTFVSLPMLGRDLLNSFSLGLSVNVADWYVWAIDLLCLLFALVGLGRLVVLRAWPSRAFGWLLAGYLAVPVLLLYLMSSIRPAYMTSRHMMLISPAFYLLLASGLTWLRRRLAPVSLAACLIVAGGIGYSTVSYFGPLYDKDPHREWGAYLRQHVRPGDVVVVDPPHIAQLYDYYASSDVPWIGLPLLNGSQAESEARLQQLFDEYDRVWLAYSAVPGWGDPTGLPEAWLNEHAFRVDYNRYPSNSSTVLVAAYIKEPPVMHKVPADARYFEIRYLPSLRLVGYGQASAARPGQNLNVRLFWQVDQPIATQASVSLRLVDGEGHEWGLGDACPFNGLFPMWQWTPGTVVRDDHEVSIAPGTPPGRYELEMVLVDKTDAEGCARAGGQTMPPSEAPMTMNRGDRVLLGTVMVERAQSAPPRDSLDMERARRVSYDGLTLIGSAIETTELRPGERIHLRLYWEATRSSLPDRQFRLLLVGPRGQVVSERTIRPVGNGLPTKQWQAGDRFEGQFWWQVPADAPWGDYVVALAPLDAPQRTGLLGTLRGWLSPGTRPVRLDRLHVVRVAPARTQIPGAPVVPPQGLAIEHPMQATLGSQVRFLGYDLDSETFQAGQSLALTLYWQALAPIDADYTVFAHLLGPENQVLGQKDGQPRGGAYPTTRWHPGEVITDTYTIATPPDLAPGRYWLEVGMYRLETLVRLPVIGPGDEPARGDRVLLESVTAAPPPTPLPTPTRVLYDRPFDVYLPLVYGAP